MKLEGLVQNLLLVGSISVAVVAMENDADAATIHDKPGATVVFSEDFTSNPTYGAFQGWAVVNNTLKPNAHQGLLAAYNQFSTGFEDIELQMRVKLGFAPNVPYRFEVALYEINVGSYYSALDVDRTNSVSGAQTTDNQPIWRSECNNIPFVNDTWHNLSFVKTGLHIETYLDGQIVGNATADKDYHVNSFNITYDDGNCPAGIPDITVGSFKLWTKPSNQVPKLGIEQTVTLTWPTNSNNILLLSSSTVNGVYSLIEKSPVLDGTNNSVTIRPSNEARFFKLMSQQ